MSKMSHKDFASVVSILDSIDKIMDYTSSFNNADESYADTKICDAAMMNFIVIGEISVGTHFRKEK